MKMLAVSLVEIHSNDWWVIQDRFTELHLALTSATCCPDRKMEQASLNS